MMRGLILLIGLLLLAGCANHSTMPSVAARLQQPTAQCLAQLSQTASSQSGRPVHLTEQAFASSAELLLEPAAALALDGRVREFPERFHLQRRGEQCELLHARTGQQAPLSACTCTALTP